jgi:hypothetical protein
MIPSKGDKHRRSLSNAVTSLTLTNANDSCRPRTSAHDRRTFRRQRGSKTAVESRDPS